MLLHLHRAYLPLILPAVLKSSNARKVSANAKRGQQDLNGNPEFSDQNVQVIVQTVPLI